MKKINKSILAAATLLAANLQASESEVGITYDGYDNAAAIGYHGKFDIGHGFNVQGSYSHVNKDKEKIFAKVDDEILGFNVEADVSHIRFGVGYEYEVVDNLNLSAGVLFYRMDVEDMDINKEVVTDISEDEETGETTTETKTVTTFIEGKEIKAKELRLGVSYKINHFEFGINGIRYDLDKEDLTRPTGEFYEDFNSVEGYASYYITESLKLNLFVQNKDLDNEEKLYRLGVSYKF